MKILLTGGSGDLGYLLSKRLVERGDHPLRLDIRPPADAVGEYIEVSIIDRKALRKTITSEINCVVHIAAWHGVHEFRKQKDSDDFWDVNVTGTYEVFEACHRADVQKVVYISSTSIDEPYGLYGHTKVLGEQIAETYVKRHGMQVITLCPRAFIPHWNTGVYNDFIEWIRWFWPGAVHISDVVRAVEKTINRLVTDPPKEHLILAVDGAYDYTADQIRDWDKKGKGATFAEVYPEYVELAKRYRLDTGIKPVILDSESIQRELGYRARYSLRNVLEELDQFGEAGPPQP